MLESKVSANSICCWKWVVFSFYNREVASHTLNSYVEAPGILCLWPCVLWHSAEPSDDAGLAKITTRRVTSTAVTSAVNVFSWKRRNVRPLGPPTFEKQSQKQLNTFKKMETIALDVIGTTQQKATFVCPSRPTLHEWVRRVWSTARNLRCILISFNPAVYPPRTSASPKGIRSRTPACQTLSYWTCSTSAMFTFLIYG